jgi:hypothetical protein
MKMDLVLANIAGCLDAQQDGRESQVRLFPSRSLYTPTSAENQPWKPPSQRASLWLLLASGGSTNKAKK